MLSWIVVSHVLDMPSTVLFKVGDRRELTCKMSSCPEKVKFSWTSIEDKPLFATLNMKDRESVLVFENVTKYHENTIVCKARCMGESKQAKTKVTVYCEFTVCFQFHYKFNRLYNALLEEMGASCHTLYFSHFFL